MRDEAWIDPFENLMCRKEAKAIISSTDRYDWYLARQKAIKLYGYAIPCREAVRALVGLSPLVEVGAGSGYWARLVRASGADVVATDGHCGEEHMKEWDSGVTEELEAIDAISKYADRNVFMCWPSYEGEWAANVAYMMKPGLSLAYIGEGKGGCTADDRFFSIIDSDFEEVEGIAIPQWSGIHDYLHIYRKNFQ